MRLEAADIAIWQGAPAMPKHRIRLFDAAFVAVPIICLLALLARIMTYPLQRDEQFYVPAGVLFSFSGLYRDLNFSHFPNLPLLLDAIYGLSGADHYLLVGRLLIFTAWVATVGALYLFGRLYAKNNLVILLMLLLLLLNPALLGAAGMAVTNNFIATPFIVGGVLAFLLGIDRPLPSIWLVALGGFLLAVGAGFKANYVLILPIFGIAALLFPPWISLGRRAGMIAAPLFVGGVIGSLPTLAFFGRDPMGFIAHCFSFHRGPQIAFWRAHPDIFDPKAIGLRDKLLLAHQSWLSATNLVLITGLLLLAVTGYMNRDKSGRWPFDWRVGLLTGTAAVVALASFLPTPAFPQYYSTPIIFGILALCLLHNSIGPAASSLMRPFYVVAIALVCVCGAPMLFSTASGLVRPNQWTGFVVHRDALAIGPKVRRGGADGRLATLYPVHALEANLPVYPHLALGPFIYRASDYIPAGERGRFRYLASPENLSMIFAQEPPAGILINARDELNKPLIDYAVRNGYRKMDVELGRMTDVDDPLLFVRKL